MTIFSVTAANAADYAAELGGVIRDAATDNDIWYRSNGTGEYLSFAFEVTLPAGATINSASINFHCPIASADEPNHTIDAEFTADAIRPAAGDANGSISGRTGTAATVNWYNADLGAPGYFDTPDISAILQELVDNFDYSAGATVLIRVYYAGTGGDIGISTPVNTGNPVATLTIDYTAPSSSVTITISDGESIADTIGSISAIANVVADSLAASDALASGAVTVELALSDTSISEDAITLSTATLIAVLDAISASDSLSIYVSATMSDESIATDSIMQSASLSVFDNSAIIDTITVTTGEWTGLYVQIVPNLRHVTIIANRRSVNIVANLRSVNISKRTV